MKIEEELPAEEALSDFWKYCEQREKDENVLAETKQRKFPGFIHKHRAGLAAAVVVIAMIFGGSWQVVNAEKHGGFFWWMNKSEEGTTMITSPEGMDEFENDTAEYYYKIEDVPEEIQNYVQIPLSLSLMREYELNEIKIIQYDAAKTIHVFMKDKEENCIHFEIIIYPREVLWIRDGYPEYHFEEKFEQNGMNYEVFEKDELKNLSKYIVYFYQGNVKYAVVGNEDKEFLKEIAIEYGDEVMEKYADQ